MIQSTNLAPWLKTLSSTLRIKETAKAVLSKKAIDRYYALGRMGAFPDLLLKRQYRSGLVHIARVR